jgi:hypothetical protein
VRGVFMDWLRSYRPDLVERYEELYARSAYLPRVEQERISGLVRRARVTTGAPRFGPFRREPGRDYEPMEPPNPGVERPPRPPEQEQTKLF